MPQRNSCMRLAAGFASEIQDPLRTPVYAWDSDEQLPLWSARRSWQGVVGYSQGCNADLGLEDFTVNYAFESCYNQIPSGLDIKSGKLLFDDDRQASWDNKLRNFYTALKFMRRAPLLDQMPETLGYSRNLWYQQGRRDSPLCSITITPTNTTATPTATAAPPCCRTRPGLLSGMHCLGLPTLWILGQSFKFLDMTLRLDSFNHTPHTPRNITFTVDGMPLEISTPTDSTMRRLTKSGKYNCHCLKVGQLLPLPLQTQQHDNTQWCRVI